LQVFWVILLDESPKLRYNTHMDTKNTVTKRKTRSDRKHAIYCITCVATGEQYVGITVASGNVKMRLKVRMQKHIRRALTEGHNWGLCVAIREHGVENFTYGLLDTVRGKLAAHRAEMDIVRAFMPALNTAVV
jgi:hypothetical protein